MSTIEIIPLGGGRDVGRSCILTRFKDGKTVMFDCGVHMGKHHIYIPSNEKKKHDVEQVSTRKKIIIPIFSG